MIRDDIHPSFGWISSQIENLNGLKIKEIIIYKGLFGKKLIRKTIYSEVCVGHMWL